MGKDRMADLKAAQGRDEDDYDAEDVEVNMEMESEYDPFLREIEGIREEINKIEENVGLVKQKHSDILASPTTDNKLKKELEALMTEIKKNGASVRGRLKAIEKTIDTDKKTAFMELRIKKTHHSCLAKKFVDVMTDYNNSQMDYRDRCKERIQRQLEICGRETTDEELENMIEKGNPQVFTQGILVETHEARQTLADIEVRHEEIMALEKSLIELRDLFADMAMIIESQGEMIDRIETHAKGAVEYVGKATTAMKQAMEYQNAAVRKKIKMFILSILIGLAVSAYGLNYLGLL